MGTKSRVRKKNGKPVKYKPKSKGLSKTQMKKLMEMIQKQQENNTPTETPEIRDGQGELLISPEFIKKLNVNKSDEIEEGPILLETEKKEEPIAEVDPVEENIEEDQEKGPLSSEI